MAQKYLFAGQKHRGTSSARNHSGHLHVAVGRQFSAQDSCNSDICVILRLGAGRRSRRELELLQESQNFVAFVGFLYQGSKSG